MCFSVVSQLQEICLGFSEVLTTLVRFIAVVSLSVDISDTYFAHDSCAFPFLFTFADEWQFDVCP